MRSRDVVFQKVIPRLRELHPDGIVPRTVLMAEIERAGLPFQPWLTSVTAGRGKYDLSSYYTLAADVHGGADQGEEVDTRSDSDVDRDVTDRFSALERLSRGVADGKFRALVLSGPPGVGKSYGVERILSTQRGIIYERVTGYARATGLYKLLYEHRESDHVLLFDDCDSIFNDEVALNLLKSACDSTARRSLAWRSEKIFDSDVDGGDIPRHFEFHGRVVFVTNIDFEQRARIDTRLAPHLQAMISRAFYLDLQMTQRETLSRVLSVARDSEILKDHTVPDKSRIVSYVKDNAERMREISLRSLIKLSQIISQTRAHEDFLRLANATMLRR